jgi:hypothetical protein
VSERALRSIVISLCNMKVSWTLSTTDGFPLVDFCSAMRTGDYEKIGYSLFTSRSASWMMGNR